MSRSSVKNAFGRSAPASKRKRPSPFTIRLSVEERAILARRAGSQPLGAYIRGRLLGEAQTARKAAPRKQRLDYELLGRILGLLGETDLAKTLCVLAVAAESGSLAVDRDVANKLNTACADVREIRLQLVAALGLKPSRKP